MDGGNNILEGLRLAVGLGGEKGASASMGKIGASGKLVTLKTLLSFINCALGQSSSGTFDGWIEQGKKGKGRAVEVSAATVFPEGLLVDVGPWGVEEDSGAWEIGRLGGGIMDDQQGVTDALTVSCDGMTVKSRHSPQQLYLQLVPLVQSTFLENAPTAFSPSSAPASTLETPVALCLTSALLTRALATPILRSKTDKTVREGVSDFVRRMAPYFPFREITGAQVSPTGLSSAFELNLAYANLAILLAPPVPPLNIKKKGGQKDMGWKVRIEAVEEAWKGAREATKSKKGADDWAIGEVAEWIEATLVRHIPSNIPNVASPTDISHRTQISWHRSSPRRRIKLS